MDTHADTCVLGKNFIPLTYTDRICDVYPYSRDYDAVGAIPVVTGATAYTDQVTGETIIIVINEGLYFGDKLDHSLVNPNQLRSYGVDVYDNTYDRNETMRIQGQDVNDENIVIPLLAEGVDIFFETRTPSLDELENSSHIHLTNKLAWNPKQVTFPQVTSIKETHTANHFYNPLANSEYDASNFSRQIMEIETRQDVPTSRSFLSQNKRCHVGPDELSERWLIGKAQASKTLKVTTQRGVRSAVLPLSRRYWGDLFYERKRLQDKFYTNTYFARHRSLHGNTCAQVFGSKNFFAEAYPMASKGQAGDALKSFITEWGVPARLTFDGAAEHVGKNTEFMQQIK